MAALLVAMAIVGVVIGMAVPAWRTLVQREREEELIFRGRQYVRAIQLYQRKFANAYPPSTDILVEQRFLRKKYKDPVNDDKDFEIVYQSMLAQRMAAQAAQSGIAGQVTTGAGRQGAAGRGAGAGSLSMPGSAFGSQVAGAQGGIAGVASKSTAKSIRAYEGRTAYNEWPFVWVASTATPRGGVRGTLTPGQRGGMQGPGGMMQGPRGMMQGPRGGAAGPLRR
jgi:type II secretory pathway pseudopilin PulG